jgi:hypothetical protein
MKILLRVYREGVGHFESKERHCTCKVCEVHRGVHDLQSLKKEIWRRYDVTLLCAPTFKLLEQWTDSDTTIS